MPHTAVHPRISLGAASSYKWSLDEDLAFYKSAGIAAMAVALSKFDADPQGVAKVLASGIAVSSVVGVGSRERLTTDNDADGDFALAKLRPSIDLAAALKCVSCYFVAEPSVPHVTADQGLEKLAKALKSAISYAHTKNVRLAVEHNSRSIVHTLADAIELAQMADVGICLELYNCWVEHHLGRLLRDHVKRFHVVQVSDSLAGEATARNRLVPGDGDMPLEWMIGLLLESGYRGFFEIETIGPRIDEEGYPDSIRRGAAWLSDRLARWGV